MSQAIAGHGALIAMEVDGDAAGTFTTVGELNGDINMGALTRPETEVTTHQDTIDQWIQGRLGRDAITWSVNFIFDDETHDHLTGLRKRIIDGDIFGLRVRGPNGTTDTDEIIVSGFLTNVGLSTNPVREGARTADVTFRPSKQMKIDGVLIGNV